MSAFFSPDGKLHASDLTAGLHTAVLPGGLKVLIREDHRLPVAICNVWVKVGSNREPEKLRGWSHGIEHMLFKGTARRNEGDFAIEVAEAGGSTNAGTGYETTNYHITVPAENLSVAVDILGDALLDSTFDAESLDAERQVLVHENHMYDDIPFGFGVTWRWGMELTYDKSPYENPIGGRDENLLERDRDEILAFYRSAYRLDNMTVVIVGDVDPQAALDLVKEKFPDQDTPGPLSNDSVILVADPPVEPPRAACRLRVEEGDIQKAYAKLIFPAPGEQDDDRPVLSVARRVLSDGRSCRLYQEVQEKKKLVDDFAVMTETGPREGIVLVDVETDPDRLVPALQAIVQVLGDLKESGCTTDELERARTRVARSFLFGEETVQGQASTLGYYEAMDDLPGAFEFPQRVDAVTSDHVAAFCQRIFQVENLNCVLYLPKGTDRQALGLPDTADALADLLVPSLRRADDTPKPATTPLSQLQTPTTKDLRPLATTRGHLPFETATLSNGVEVCYRVDRSLPVFAMALAVRGGATAETTANAGLSALMQTVQVKGTAGLDAATLHEQLENEGASLSPQADRDFGGLVLSGLSDRLDKPLDLLGQLACHPSFPDHEIDQERRLALEQLASLADSPFQWGAVKLRELVYGDHPYGRPLVGTTGSLPDLKQADLMARHQEAWTAANLRIAVSGSLDPDVLLPRLESVLADLPAGSPTERPTPGGCLDMDGVQSHRLTKQQNQSVVLVAWPGPLTPDENRVPLMMLKEVLNGQSGRLFEQLRNRRSMCYNTGVLSTAGFGQGFFMGYVLTSPEQEADAREALVHELIGMTAGRPDPVEFERARAKLIGNLLISCQANSTLVHRTGRDRLYGRQANDLPHLLDAIRACTPQDVQGVATALIHPEARFEVTVGP